MELNNSKYISKSQLAGSYLSVTISISLVTFILGLILLLIINAKKLADYAKENIGVLVMLKSDENEMNTMRLQKELDASDFVLETSYISKEEAAKQLKKELGEDFVNFLGYNPLSSSIEIKVHAEYANLDSLKVIKNKLTGFELVKDVYYQKSLVGFVNENVEKISIVLLCFSILFIFISVVLINNSIRLSFYSKRFLINTMQLVGASPQFIMKPFLLKSMFVAALAALFAILFMIITIYFLQSALADVISIQHELGVFAIMLSLSVIFTVISTYFALNKSLKLKSHQLYY